MTTSETLRAVDDALRGGRPDSADPDLRELQEIALVLQADVPAPDPAFVSGLDQRVARRFERPARSRRLPHRRAILAAAASVVALVAVIGALAGVLRSGGTAPTRPSVETAAPLMKPSHATKGPAPAGTIPLTAAAAPARRVERDAQLTLAAPAGKLDDVANGIVTVTDRHRGVVLDSSLSTGSDSGRGGSFSLRVPSSELSQTLRDLSRLGEVRARSQSGHDVTGSYNRLSDRLAAARVERRGLMRRLAHATSTTEADRIRTRLDELSLEIQGLSGNLGDIRRRTDFTRISVTLMEQQHRTGALGGAGDAFRGSLRALVGATAVTLRVVAVVLPFALLGALAWAAAAGVRRRRREAVLS